MQKKLLVVLIVVFVLAVPLCENSLAASYDTSVFGANAVDLLEEHFTETFTVTGDDNKRSRPSGWDIDYRGGNVRVLGGALNVTDTSDSEKISMKHDIMAVKDGEMTFETAVSFDNKTNSTLTCILGNDISDALKLRFENGNIYYYFGKNKISCASFNSGEKIFIKAELSIESQKIKLHINNETVAYYDILNDCGEITRVEFTTDEKSTSAAKIYFVNAYKNYIVKENFMTAKEGTVPEGFTLSSQGTGSGIAYAPGSPYGDDRNGFLLKNTASSPQLDLSKTLSNYNTNLTLSWTMLFETKQDGVSVNMMNNTTKLFTVKTMNGNIYAGNKMIKENYSPNVWYTFSVDIDSTEKAVKLSLNGIKSADTIAYDGGLVNKLVFSKSADGMGNLIIDDIKVEKTFEKYADYPSAPQTVHSDDANTAMIMYPMWREGMHYGWDTISPYADERKPLMGYYAEGEREAADWQNKWLLEHGVDYAVYPFVRPNSVSGEPIKKPIRGEDLHDGYMNSYYGSNLKFAILFSGFGTNQAGQGYPDPTGEKKYHGADEFIKNVVPYISEYYFQNPNYMKINNRLPVFSFALPSLNSTFGSIAETKKVIEALNAEAVRLGYDGIIFAADASTPTGHSLVESLNLDYISVWSYGLNSGDPKYLMTKIDEEYAYSPNYIASIPMGYDDTPWRTSTSKMMTPDEVSSICEHVKAGAGFKNSEHKMVVFTCWNEYGEGHYYAPSSKGGFGYLNAIRSNFTSNGIKTDEETPSEKSVARMEVLYPNGRGALKLLADKSYTDEDMKNRKLLYRCDFSSAENAPCYWTEKCTWQYKNGNLEAVATSKGAGLYFTVDSDTDISDVEVMKIRTYTKGGHSIRVYYMTTDNPNEGEGKFFEATSVSGTDEYDEYILYPNSSMSVTPTGKITKLRINPSDDLYANGANFGIDYVEFYGKHSEQEVLYRHVFDNENYKSVSAVNTTKEFKNNSLTCTANANDPQLYLNIETGVDIADVTGIKIKAYTKGTNELSFYYITEDNASYGGGKVFKTNTVSGNEALTEYVLTHNDIAQMPTGKIVGIRIDPADDIADKGAVFAIAEFEILGETINQKLKINNEYVKFTSMPKVKNGAVYLPIYSVLFDEMNAYPVWDEPSKTLTFEYEGKTLSITADSLNAKLNGMSITWKKAPYYEKGNLYVPHDEFFGSLGYNAVYNKAENVVTLEKRETFSLSAQPLVYGDNILRNYSGDTASRDYGANNASYTEETIDGKSVAKIVPSNAGTDGLFFARWVNYNGEYVSLNEVIKAGGKMRVSFSYKGVGTGIEVENRSGSGIDKKISSSAPSADVWQEFSYVFDNKDLSTTDSRWLAIRLRSASGTNPYLYISDFKIQCLEKKESEFFDGDIDISFKPISNDYLCQDYKCFVAEYEGGKVINIKEIASGNTGETNSDVNYTYNVCGGDTVKFFLWSDLTPLCENLKFESSSGSVK